MCYNSGPPTRRQEAIAANVEKEPESPSVAKRSSKKMLQTATAHRHDNVVDRINHYEEGGAFRIMVKVFAAASGHHRCAFGSA